MKNLALHSLLYPLVKDTVEREYFAAKDSAVDLQLLMWRERMGSVLDLLPSKTQVERPFDAWVHRYSVGNLSFADLYSDPIRVERSLARISVERACDFFLFCICVDGDSHTLEGKYARRAPFRTKILAIDLDQPIRMQGHRHRFSSFFVPRQMLESILPNADTLHARSLDDSTPLARLLINRTAILNEQIGSMNVVEAKRNLWNMTQLIVGAFGKQARLSGNTRAAIRSVMFDHVRTYIKKSLDNPELSAEMVLRKLQLPRDTLYRMFEHEGGIAAYISDCRLRSAAEDIARLPLIPLKDIAYGVGFNSASAFSRAFRRCYDISPQELREIIANNSV